MVKIYKRRAFIEACYDIFLHEIIEYNITHERGTGAILKKTNWIRIIGKNQLKFKVVSRRY